MIPSSTNSHVRSAGCCTGTVVGSPDGVADGVAGREGSSDGSSPTSPAMVLNSHGNRRNPPATNTPNTTYDSPPLNGSELNNRNAPTTMRITPSATPPICRIGRCCRRSPRGNLRDGKYVGHQILESCT